MAGYKCSVCETIYDEEKEGRQWDQLAADWTCNVCESGKSFWRPVEATAAIQPSTDDAATAAAGFTAAPEKGYDDFEIYMADIHTMAETGQSIIEPMPLQSEPLPRTLDTGQLSLLG